MMESIALNLLQSNAVAPFIADPSITNTTTVPEVSSIHPSDVNDQANDLHWTEAFEYDENPETLVSGPSRLDEVSASLQRMLEDKLVFDEVSDNEEVERSDIEEGVDGMNAAIEVGDEQGVAGSGAPRPRNYTPDQADHREWFPWGDKLSCTLDILTHLPRSVFSDKQLDLLLWLLQINGVDNVPSVFTMKEDQKGLQNLVGIDTTKYNGALGHTYYVNDIRQIIAQDMANPRVRPYLRFYPEDSGRALSEAWQGARWLNKVESSLLTPMIRIGATGSHQDYYINEPTLLKDGKVCMPYRWFTRHNKFVAKAWDLELCQMDGRAVWVIREDRIREVTETELQLSLPFFEKKAQHSGLPSSHLIVSKGSTLQLNRALLTV
ncbi:hypothetical protein FRC02_005141 [Tulasnella sp. 418]|nr:hypothetical protein FRC02_005141 [Tulasnella sp. 418]